MLAVILAELKTEEKSKFSSVYYEYRTLMANRAYSILNDHGLAEDAVQNAFLKILKNIKCIGEVKSTRTKNFVVIVTENCAKDIYRKEHRVRFVDLDDIDISENIENEIEAKMTAENIRRLINELPDIYTDVLLLKYFNGLSDKEIASALSVSLATVRKRLLRGKQRLSVLKEDDQNDK